ncbi:hypothetical protein Tco_1119585, partial [Tanacetum coccineum]
MQGVSKTDFEKYVKANDAVLRNMQNQGQGLQNQMTNLMEMLSKFITSNTASSWNSGTLPSQTVTNPREHVNAITTRSGKTCERPSTPHFPTPIVSTPLKEPEQNPETSMDKVQKPSSESTAQVPSPEDHDSIFIEIPKPKAKKTVQEPIYPYPNAYQPKLPYPERMKVREKDKPSAQQSRFMKLFKQLRIEIGLKDALIEMSKFNKWLSALLRNKEKLEEIAITTVNAEWRPFLRTAKALIDLYEEKLTLRVGNDELVFYAENSKKSKNKQFAHAISIIDFSKDEPFSGSTTNHSDDLPPSSSPVKTSDILRSSPMNSFFLKKVESFAPEDEIDEIDAFLAMEVSSNFEEGYFNSEGDIIFLENLLSDNTTHKNKMNPSIILRLLFLQGVILFTMSSPENVHVNLSSIIESLPVSLIPVEDSDPIQEEIDIFLVPDDLIPPGVENDDSEDEDNSTFLPENESSNLEPSSPRPSPEPPDVCFNIEPDTAMKNDEEIVLSLN